MSHRVLIVEDDSAWREILIEMVEELGLAPHSATSYEAALEALEQGPYDLALLDISLSETHDNEDGLRILEQFRVRYPHVPAVILTGYATIELAVRALAELDADDFLRKEQFDRRRFEETVQRVLRAPTPRTVSTYPTTLPVPAVPPTESLDASVLVVEDNPAWRSIYEELLEECGVRYAMAVSYGEARGLLQRESFDVAIVDLKLASSTEPQDNRDGFHLLRLTQEARLPTLVVSALGEPQEIDRAYDSYGIFAFFDKEGFQRNTFLRTLRDAVAHEPAPREPLADAPPPLADSPLALLTDRQLEVLALMAQGKTNNEIAEEIVVSVNTVKKHVLAIFAALGVNTRSAAAAVAVRYGLRAPEDGEG